MERARDLFEQAITKIPPEETRPIYLMYATLEEDHGLVKNAMSVYDRACKLVSPAERHHLHPLHQQGDRIFRRHENAPHL